MMKRLRNIALCAIVLLSACSHHRHEDKMIFRYNESAGIATLDPAFAKDQSIIWPCRQLYNGLIQLDEDLDVQPCIAKRWEISPDGLTYTFTLRDDVRFHNGRTVTANNNQGLSLRLLRTWEKSSSLLASLSSHRRPRVYRPR